MATQGDGKIAANQLCELVGVTHQTRMNWEERGYVAPLPQGAGLTDALELRAFFEISQALRPSDVPLAWGQVQPQLTDRVPGAELDVVFDLQTRAASVAATTEALAEQVRAGHPVRVIPLGSALRETRDAFQVLSSPPATPYPPVEDGKRQSGPGAEAG